MPYIFRTAVSVARKQPFVDWANSLDDEGPELTLELAQTADTVYLVGDAGFARSVDDVLRDWWEDIFEEELAGWNEDEARWPVPRTRKLFDAWFDVQVANTVIDLAPDEPLTEDDMEAAHLDIALNACGWCERDLEQTEGRVTGFKLEDRKRFEYREGCAISLAVGQGRVVNGVVTPADSTPAREGYDLMFRACSRRCEKLLQKTVPRALRKLVEPT